MADLVFSGLKLAYKAFTAYSDVKEELGEFEEDFEELEMRLQALGPVINALEGKLTDDLTMVLTIAKREQEKANAYTQELFEYCRRFKEKGTQFKAIATALASKAIDSLPDGLREGAEALLPVVAKHGVPEKAYAKFAEKLHFLMSSLSAAAATQALQGSGAPRTPAPAAAATARESGESKAPEPMKMSAAEQSEKLNALVNEMVEEDEADFRAILLGRIRSTIVFAVWVEKIPHLMIVEYMVNMPGGITIMRAPSTKFLVDLSQNGLPRRKCCTSQLKVLTDMCRREAARELKISGLRYRISHTRRVKNKWLLALSIPYVNFFFMLCVPCMALCARTLQIRDFKLHNKTHNIKIENSTELSVNGKLLLDTKDLGVTTGCIV